MKLIEKLTGEEVDEMIPDVDLPSQSLAQNRQYRDTVTCLPTHTEQNLSRLRRSKKSVPEVAVS